ncbi:TPA: hypothetical protein L4Q96_001361 [Pseudomonas aeruginosa]|nr:hypothetical protein [Pseudomonas aeruginosa]HBO4010632.1 hypothetical protein [Pseudomonas aeruginosa]
MRDDAEILSRMIKSSATVALDESYGKPCLTLREPQAPDSLVTVRNVPADTVAIKVDAFTAPDAVFKGEQGECKRADYVLISPQRRTIVYIEVKRTRDGLEDIVKQLKGAQCFVHYCRDIGSTFWGEANFLNGYQHRFVSIGHTTLAKRKTRIERTAASHDNPSKPLKIDWPHNLQFNQLAGA